MDGNCAGSHVGIVTGLCERDVVETLGAVIEEAGNLRRAIAADIEADSGYPHFWVRGGGPSTPDSSALSTAHRAGDRYDISAEQHDVADR
ncbi:hypothetical protein R1CP_39930 (plasmid) [Rhodococcus opacus]|uniref:Uncharacterized protein n=1 Tax=Rhodococcus opacus TaxID=37919 RepID=A0A1B1KIY9_RHOOP|nr:hypothetical protein R1CP_39930 [Rhodococcus opacus]